MSQQYRKQKIMLGVIFSSAALAIASCSSVPLRQLYMGVPAAQPVEEKAGDQRENDNESTSNRSPDKPPSLFKPHTISLRSLPRG